MNLEVEHGIIALLLIAFLYYFFTHQSLLSDLFKISDKGNPQLKVVKNKHTRGVTCRVISLFSSETYEHCVTPTHENTHPLCDGCTPPSD